MSTRKKSLFSNWGILLGVTVSCFASLPMPSLTAFIGGEDGKCSEVLDGACAVGGPAESTCDESKATCQGTDGDGYHECEDDAGNSACSGADCTEGQKHASRSGSSCKGVGA